MIIKIILAKAEAEALLGLAELGKNKTILGFKCNPYPGDPTKSSALIVQGVR